MRRMQNGSKPSIQMVYEACLRAERLSLPERPAQRLERMPPTEPERPGEPDRPAEPEKIPTPLLKDLKEYLLPLLNLKEYLLHLLNLRDLPNPRDLPNLRDLLNLRDHL
ncbi:hypothetical protein TNCV_5024891 [Trichonephila clavipes]|nr:hypothetical protein TNCV_5024891 [Trichonephila clavipes]